MRYVYLYKHNIDIFDKDTYNKEALFDKSNPGIKSCKEAEMEPKFNLWIENNGNVVMSLWRASFLQAIASNQFLKRSC